MRARRKAVASKSTVKVTSNVEPFKRLMKLAKTEAMVATAAKIVQLSKQNVPRGVTGALSRSIAMGRPQKDAKGIEYVGVGFTAGASKYGRWVHQGREPGSRQPPIEALLVWVQRILKVRTRALKSDRIRLGMSTGTEQRKAFRMRRKENDIKGLAFVVARAIKRRGIKGRPFMMDAYDAVVGVGGGVEAELKRRLASLRGLMKEIN